jgi:hypothetical protein
MLYHLNLHFDPRKDECKNGHFVDYSASERNIHKRSKHWVRFDPVKGWTSLGGEDTTGIKPRTGDEIVIAIGTPPELGAEVKEVTLMIGKDESFHEPIPGNPFKGQPDNKVKLEGKPSTKDTSDGTKWTEFPAGVIQPKPTTYSGNQRHYRFMVSATFNFGSGDLSGEYFASHDPVMEVDDGPRG